MCFFCLYYYFFQAHPNNVVQVLLEVRDHRWLILKVQDHQWLKVEKKEIFERERKKIDFTKIVFFIHSSFSDRELYESPPLQDAQDGWNSESDTVSTISDLIGLRNSRRNGLAERERQLDAHSRELERKEKTMNDRERGLQARERRLYQANVPHDQDLKQKVDRWLEKPRKQRDMFIDVDIVGFAMTQHPYTWLSSEDRRRINCVRYEIDKMQDIARENALEELCCPICFDSYRTPGREFSALGCGHIHCLDCISHMAEICGDLQNLKCAECLVKIEMDKLRRLFFASRR